MTLGATISRNRNRAYLGFNDFWTTIIGIPVLGFFIPLLFFGASLDDRFLVEMLEATYYSAGHWFCCRWMCIQLRKRYPDFSDAKKRILLQIILCTVIALTVSPLLFSVHSLVANVINYEINVPTLIVKFGAPFVASFLVLSIYEVVYFYKQLKESIAEKEAMKRLHLESQWKSLRNQVNPHFLFNNLNTLVSLVHEDASKAESFIKRLSSVYRYVLENHKDPLVTVEEELKFIQSYVFLQEERFRPNLKVEIDVPLEFRTKMMVPMALQILVENAIKHNTISKKKPLHIIIGIEAYEKTLFVSNNLQKKQFTITSTKVGLANLQKRYQYFTKQEVRIEEIGQEFKVSLPLLESQKNLVHMK